MTYNAMDIIVLVLLFCVFAYLWMKIKDKLHFQLKKDMNNYNKNFNDGKGNEEEEEEEDGIIEKNNYILEVASWEAGILSYKLVAVAFILILFLYGIRWVFGLYNKFSNKIQYTREGGDYNLTDKDNNYFYELHHVANPEKQIQQKPESMFFKITYIFLMDFKIGTITTVVAFILTYLYHHYMFSTRDSWDLNAMHMHIDYLMFLMLIVFSIALYYSFLELKS